MFVNETKSSMSTGDSLSAAIWRRIRGVSAGAFSISEAVDVSTWFSLLGRVPTLSNHKI